ncbi:MAG: DUF2281 domain-containing protein [Bacteroidetes bacterium]|nr:DUF2281 domain-containing protein [Bacteroidota bacterium]
MSWTEIVEKIKTLPPSAKKEIEDYLEQKLAHFQNTGNKQPVFGSAKGMFVMKADFDEPLDDFKEYM